MVFVAFGCFIFVCICASAIAKLMKNNISERLREEISRAQAISFMLAGVGASGTIVYSIAASILKKMKFRECIAGSISVIVLLGIYFMLLCYRFQNDDEQDD